MPLLSRGLHDHLLTFLSHLQDLACKGCGEILGLRCHDAPPGHILRKDQIILRLNKMSVISERTGKPSTPSIKHTYALTRKGSKNGGDNNVHNNTNGGNGHDRDLAVDSGVSLDDADRLQNLSHFAEWAEGAIDTQKKDIDRISASVNKIEKDMRSFKDFMTMVRKELTVRPTNIEMDEVRATVSSLRDEIHDSKHDRRGAEGSLSFEDVDLMTESITTISSKVNEIDSLKLDLQMMKSRLKRFEDGAKERGMPMGSRPARNESPAYIRPLVEKLRGAAAGIDKHIPNSAASENVTIKRRRISDEEIIGPPTSRIGSNPIVRKPSRLSNVQLPDDSPGRIERDFDDFSGLTYVEDDDVYEPPKLQNKRLSAIPRGVAHTPVVGEASPAASKSEQPQNQRLTTPADTDQTSATGTKPNASRRGGDRRSQAFIANMQMNAGGSPTAPQSTPRKKKTQTERDATRGGAREGSQQIDVENFPLTANGTIDRRYKTGAYVGKFHTRNLKAKRKNRGGSREERMDEYDDEYDEDYDRQVDEEKGKKIVPSVERDGALATPRTALVYQTKGQDISVEEKESIRQETLEARERLVRETMESEMSMGI